MSASTAVARQPASLNSILAAVGREIADVGFNASRLQVALSPLRQPGPRNLDRLQDLDLLTQRCGAVADFLDALAFTLPLEWTGDAVAAARAVTLSDVASRLAVPGRAGGFERQPPEAAFELFED